MPNADWEAAKMPDVTNEFEYSCLTAIIETYKLQSLFEAEEYKLLECYAEEKLNQFYLILTISRSLRIQLLEQFEETLIDIRNGN